MVAAHQAARNRNSRQNVQLRTLHSTSNNTTRTPQKAPLFHSGANQVLHRNGWPSPRAFSALFLHTNGSRETGTARRSAAFEDSDLILRPFRLLYYSGVEKRSEVQFEAAANLQPGLKPSFRQFTLVKRCMLHVRVSLIKFSSEPNYAKGSLFRNR